LSNSDELIGDLYLNEKTPSKQEIKNAIRRCVIKRTFMPIFVGSALKNKGTQALLDGVVDYLPNPNEVKNFALDETDPKYLLVSPN
jgi:elongation factor G